MNMVIDDLCMGCMEARGAAAMCAACGWVEGTPAANPVHLPPRTVLRDHYVIGRVLGHGGFGIAYLAWDEDLQMKVAVKEFLPGDFATRGTDGTTVMPYSGESREHFEYGLTRFLEEGRAVVRFNEHPGIVPVLGFFRANGTGYLVMTYVPGMSLKQYLALKGGRIPFAEAVGIVMPVMDTLRVVHEAGLLHRDISPDNIYLSATKRVKLLDFGAARLALGDRSKSLSVILKAGYAPFEQYQTRGRQGPWTDIYALAATIYRAVTGEPPPEAPSRIGEDALRPPRDAGAPMSGEAEAVLLRALAVDHARRFQRVDEFQHELLRVTAPRPPTQIVRGDDWASRGYASSAEEDVDRQTDGRGVRRDRSLDLDAVRSRLHRLLQAVVARLDGPARRISEVVARRTGLRIAPAHEAPARTVALAIALIAGLLGAWVSVPLVLFFAGLTLTSGSLAVAVIALRVLAGLIGAVAMTIGAAAAFAREERGASIVWASGWFLIACGLIGMVAQVVSQLTQTTIAFLPLAVFAELKLLLSALAPTALVLGLLWLRPRAAADRVSGREG